jgi:hypothetical protein
MNATCTRLTTAISAAALLALGGAQSAGAVSPYASCVGEDANYYAHADKPLGALVSSDAHTGELGKFVSERARQDRATCDPLH